ncbi:hypothetical protein PF004_g32635 [Phytophthora fragariae]|uniref:Uncharacterized protein n=1 Tax=Phytophthora fragariae TaxID=53985 RepID=A0A6G0M6B6_9STRA|nr:hypothetical protein PF004_g32635 [Phytophthora fragariae]
MGLPGWMTRRASVICLGDHSTSPSSWSTSGSDSSLSTSKDGCGDGLRPGGEVGASFAEAASSFVDVRARGAGESAPLTYPGFGVSVSDESLLTSS